MPRHVALIALIALAACSREHPFAPAPPAAVFEYPAGTFEETAAAAERFCAYYGGQARLVRTDPAGAKDVSEFRCD